MILSIETLIIGICCSIYAGIGNNLLENSGFENLLGSERQMKTNPGITIIRDATEKFSGQYSLKVEDTIPVYTDYYGCNQTIFVPSTNPWMTLQASVKIKKLTGLAGSDIHYLNTPDQRLPIYDAKILLDSKGSSSNWKEYSMDFYIPDDTKKISLALIIKRQGGKRFDKLSLQHSETAYLIAKKPSDGAFILNEENPLIWFEFAEQKVYRETPVPKGIIKSEIHIAGARNEWESFQIVVRPKSTLKNCTIEFTDLVHTNTLSIIRKNQLTHYIEGYVDIKKRSTINGVKGLNPDYLLQKDRFDILAQSNNPIWINIKIPVSAQHGIYQGQILLKIGEKPYATIPLQVTVWNFILPQNTHLYVRSNFWFSLIKKYDFRDNNQILADYYENLQNHRINAFGTIYLKTKIINDTLVCLFDEFGQKIKNLFDNYGFEAITVGPFFGDAAGWKFRQKWMGVNLESPKFKYLLRQYCKKLESYLMVNGWLDRCWLSYWDEPQLDDPGFKKIVEIGRIIKETAPNVKIFMTKWPIPELFGIVDIWCLPFTKRYFFQQAITERKSLGEKIFVYHNNPYIDTPLIDKRLYAWRYRLADIDGVYAWWNLTFWQKDPYKFPFQVEKKGDEENILKPGDGILLYPNPDGNGPPVNSLRWEVFHQGIEDYEYFWLLEQAILRAYKRLHAHNTFTDYTTYRINEYLSVLIKDYFDPWSRDVNHLYKLRYQIADEIQTIEQSPIVLIKTQPQEGHLELNQIINITGLTEMGTKVLINNKPVSVNDDGLFKTHIKNPPDGIVVIKVKLGRKEKIIKKQYQL